VGNFASHNTGVLFLKANQLKNKNVFQYFFLSYLMVLTFNIRHSSDVIFSGQNKFIINNPLWLVIQTRGRVKLNILVVFYGEIVTSSLQVSHLTEKIQKQKN
jgi:hypothetical protein